jgi:aryl-alcohol dehydrogenase
MKISAAVVREKGGPFSVGTLDLDTPRADEVVVRIVGVGVCHTDLKVRDQIRPTPLPIVLGHEGAGIVEQVGQSVSKVQPGDHVVLSYHACGRCANCLNGQPAYCREVIACNFGGARLDGSPTMHQHGQVIHGAFFNQSSFATYALASERNVVKVRTDAPLAMLGPLGCGFQTGAGAVLNSLRARAGTAIAIFGVGSVGLSAVMAAVIAGCTTIIAVDIKPNRLALARELGATQTINSTEVDDPVTAIREMSNGGVDYALDTSGQPAVFRQAVDALKILGVCGLIGGVAPGIDVRLEMNHLLLGRTVRGIVQGDSIPDIFIPRLIELHLQGRFPFDRLIKFYALDQINQACADVEAGHVLKPVLRPTTTA